MGLFMFSGHLIEQRSFVDNKTFIDTQAKINEYQWQTNIYLKPMSMCLSILKFCKMCFIEDVKKAHLAKIENWQTHCMSIYWSKNDSKFIFRL